MTPSESLPMATHTVLPGAKWALWRQVVLRAPGFPAAGVELLASPGLARAADSLNEQDADDSAGKRLSYQAAFQAETERLSSQILRLAADRRFGLALAWQNHQIFDTAIAPMLRRKADDRIRRNSKQRQHEELIASYWQRYCVKNDTVGFFGPVGWATLDPATTATRLRAGKALIASSEVFFEPWVIDQLAKAIGADPAMAAWIPPRKPPFVRLEAQQANGPTGVPAELTAAELAVLRRCTGQTPACEIAGELIGLVPDAATSEALIYHDARRDAQFVLGADFLAALEPLGMVLDSARWLTFNFATRLQELFTSVAARMATSGASLDLASFWFECMPVIHRSAPDIVRELQRDFQQRWANILRIPPGSRRVRRQGTALREGLLAAFSAPHSGWSAGRYYSPDLMVAASGVDAINRGDFEIVLGELHMALATSRHYCFVTQHPSPGDLLDCLTVDSPGPRLLPVVPKEDHERLTIRTQSALIRDMDFLVALSVQTAEPGRPRLLHAADLTVTPNPAGPTVTIPGGPSFPVIDVFAEMIVHVFMNSFALLPDSAHQPRIAIDRLVIARETWRFEAAQIDFAQLRDEPARFAAARHWRHSAGLPRRAFVQVPGEVKPFYADFDSIVSVNVLAKSLRRLQGQPPGSQRSLVQFSEMLPSADNLWLTDAEGHRYTSEIRIVAVDQQGPGAACPP